MSFASDVKMKLHGSILKQKKENALNCSDFADQWIRFPIRAKSGHSFYDGNAALARRVLRLLKNNLLFRPKSL